MPVDINSQIKIYKVSALKTECCVKESSQLLNAANLYEISGKMEGTGERTTNNTHGLLQIIHV